MKVNPAKQLFRLADSLADAQKHSGVMALQPTQHESDLRIGDRIYLWQTGERGGLCATATIKGPTERRPQPEWQQAFGNPETYDSHAHRVLLQIERYTTKPVSRDLNGANLWTPNGGTTQQCPSTGCPSETLAKFDAIAEMFDSISLPSIEEYRRLLEAAAGRSETDRIVQALVRTEQAYWRKTMFGSSSDGTCAICGRVLPVELLVAAHIKQRCNCSHNERLDPDNVMAACLMGCDALFERGYIRVDNGTVQGNGEQTNGAVKEAIVKIAGKSASLGAAWTDNRARYFRARHG